MENSMTSMSKSLSSGAKTVDSPEESSWTSYFEDFFLCNNNNSKEYNSLSSDYESHLVSDAASLAAKKVTDKIFKQLGFKKRKSKGAIVDDDLEDTASSPINNPKNFHAASFVVSGSCVKNSYTDPITTTSGERGCSWPDR